MMRKTPSLIVRAIQLAPIVTCMFAGCTCSGNAPQVPIPTATIRPMTPTAVVLRSTYTPQLTAAVAASPTVPPAAPLTATPSESARRTQCERFVAALSGREKDDALLGNPELRALARGATSLVMCGAVMADSSAMCKRLLPEEHGPSAACLHLSSIFHELRAYPKGRTFMFTENDWKDCRQLRPKECDAFREAIRSGDDKACASTGDLQPMCRAFVSLDPSLCRFSPEAERRLTEGRKKDGSRAEDECKEAIESRKFLAKGLTALAESGPPRERALAKAALGQADACAPYTEPVMQSCMTGPSVPVSGTPVPQAPASSGASPPTP